MPLTTSGQSDAYKGGVASETRYLALFDGDPTNSSSDECSGGGYARLSKTAAQQPVSGGQIRISMGEWDDSADDDWGVMTHVAMFDASSGGNLKWWALISPALPAIVAGSRVFSNAGDITVEIPLS